MHMFLQEKMVHLRTAEKTCLNLLRVRTGCVLRSSMYALQLRSSNPLLTIGLQCL
jgi:hypothetical protein